MLEGIVGMDYERVHCPELNQRKYSEDAKGTEFRRREPREQDRADCIRTVDSSISKVL